MFLFLNLKKFRCLISKLVIIGLFFCGSVESSSAQHYNFKFGKLTLDLAALLEVEFNDNITASELDPVADIIVRPGLSVRGDWNLTKLNHLSFSTDMMYDWYLFHSDLGGASRMFSFSPDSEFDFVVFIENVTLKFYDQFSYCISPADSISVDPSTLQPISDVANYTRLTNQIGVNVNWDLNDVIVFGNIYRDDLIPQSATFDFIERTGYTLSLGVQALVQPNVTLGVIGSYSTNDYKTDYQNDSRVFSIGPFGIWEVGPNLMISAQMAYVVSDFDSTGLNGDTSQPTAVTGNVTFTHQWSDSYQHSLALNRSSQYGLVSNTTEINSVEYGFAWQLFSWSALKGNVFYEKGKDSGGVIGEDYHRFGGGLGMDFRLRPRLTASARYDYDQKDSDREYRSYDRNRFLLRFQYDL